MPSPPILSGSPSSANWLNQAGKASSNGSSLALLALMTLLDCFFATAFSFSLPLSVVDGDAAGALDLVFLTGAAAGAKDR